LRQLSVDTRLKNISVDIQAGEVLGLIGPNGAGKSTLLNTLAGLESYDGELLVKDASFSSYKDHERARLIGLQPQQVNSAWSISVRDVVALGRLPWGDSNKDEIDQAMHFAGVTGFADRAIDHLSGGERARVWLARVLAGKPEVLLMDEPVANLDIHYQLSVMGLLQSYADEGKAVVVALHDLGLAARYCNKLCLLNDGALIAYGNTKEVLNAELLKQVYGVDVDIDLQRDPPIVLPK
jgi:iron complex transport system ATP-binding protein